MISRRILRAVAHRNMLFTLVAAAIFATFAVQVQSASAAGDTNYNMAKACAQLGTQEARIEPFDSFAMTVNDKAVPTTSWNISKYVKSGDTVTVTFKLKDGLDANGKPDASEPDCANTYVGLSMYETPSDHFLANEAAQQKLASRKDGKFGSTKTYTLTATVPDCYFQMDLNTGKPYKPGDYALDHQGRLIMAANGGTKACTADTTTTEKPTVAATASISQKCDTDDKTKSAYIAKLQNTGDGKASFTVMVEEKEIKGSPFAVAAGKALNVALPSEEDTAMTATISESASHFSKDFDYTLNCEKATSTPVSNDTCTNTCTNPCKTECQDDNTNSDSSNSGTTEGTAKAAATLTQSCLANGTLPRGYRVALKNTGEVEDSFTVKVDGNEVSGSPFSVPADKSRVVNVAMKDGESKQINVSESESMYKLVKTVTLKCGDTNSSDSGSSGSAGTSGTPASTGTGSDTSDNCNCADKKDTKVTSATRPSSGVSNDETDVVKSPMVAKSTASLAQQCDADSTRNGYTLSMKNTGTVDETFTVMVNGEEIADSPVAVAAGKNDQILLDVTEDEATKVAVKGEESGFSLNKSVTLNCVKTIAAKPASTSSNTTDDNTDNVATEAVANKSTTGTGADELAFTGFNAGAVALLALCLLIIGLGFFDLARRVRA